MSVTNVFPTKTQFDTMNGYLNIIANGHSKVTLTITLTPSVAGTSLVGQEIKIYDGVVSTSTVYATIVYTGQPATIEVPYGFNYIVKAVCTVPNFFCSDVVSGIASLATSIVLNFQSIGSLSTFPDVKAVLESGYGKYIQLGSQVSFTHTTLGSLVWDIVNFNQVDNSCTLLLHDTLPDMMQFDAPEASKYCSSALTAGDYSFVHSSTTYYFTTTTEIPIGGQLRLTTSAFTSYSSQDSTTVLESGTVSTTAISGATSLGTTASELNHMDRVNYGSNDYGESNIRQWLNATTASDWWIGQTQFDRPCSYVSTAGFAYGVPSDVMAVIDTTTVKCIANNAYKAPDSSHTKNMPYTCSDKFFLASRTEIFNNDDGSGSSLFGYYNGKTATDRIKKYNNSARHWWLRSPNSSNARYEYNVYSSGTEYNNGAYISCGVVPACVIHG